MKTKNKQKNNTQNLYPKLIPKIITQNYYLKLLPKITTQIFYPKLLPKIFTKLFTLRASRRGPKRLRGLECLMIGGPLLGEVPREPKWSQTRCRDSLDAP